MDKSHYSIDGYSMFCLDPSIGRGCVLYIKASIPVIHIEFDNNFQESLWCSVNLTGSDKLLIGCIYRSPNSNIENNKEHLNLFLKVKDLNPSHTLIIGDFNFGEINWRINNSHTNENHIASQFLECIRDCFLYQHVKENTRS